MTSNSSSTDTPLHQHQLDRHSEHEIQYPTIHVNTSLASLVSSESAGTPKMRKPPQNIPSSLEDSTFEVVDADTPSEDEDGRTASLTSGASVDGRTPDDLLSLAGTEQSIDEDHHDVLSNPPEPFENVTRLDAAHSHMYNNQHTFDSSDESDTDDDEHDSPLLDSVISAPEHELVQDSDMTARPASPPPEPTMSPSIPRADLPHQGAWTAFRELCDGLKQLTMSTVEAVWHLWNRQDVEARAVRILGTQFVLAALAVLLAAHLMPNFSVNYEAINKTAATVPSVTPTSADASTSAMSDWPIEMTTGNDVVTDAVSGDAQAKTDMIKIVKAETALSVPLKATAFLEDGGFTAQIMGDNHVLITAPKHFRRLKRVPDVAIGVMRRASGTRKTQLIDALVTVVDGVHIVSVDREQAYGELTLVVSTKSKPKVEQSFTLDFGSPWLKLSRYSAMTDRLSKAAFEEFQTASSAMAENWEHTSEKLSELAKEGLKVFEKSRGQATDLASKFAATASKMAAESLEKSREDADKIGKAVGNAVTAAEKELTKAYKTIRSVTEYMHPAQILLEQMHGAPSMIERAHQNARGLLKKIQESNGCKASKPTKRMTSKWEQLKTKARKTREQVEAIRKQANDEKKARQEGRRARRDARRASRCKREDGHCHGRGSSWAW